METETVVCIAKFRKQDKKPKVETQLTTTPSLSESVKLRNEIIRSSESSASEQQNTKKKNRFSLKKDGSNSTLCGKFIDKSGNLEVVDSIESVYDGCCATIKAKAKKAHKAKNVVLKDKLKKALRDCSPKRNKKKEPAVPEPESCPVECPSCASAKMCGGKPKRKRVKCKKTKPSASLSTMSSTMKANCATCCGILAEYIKEVAKLLSTKNCSDSRVSELFCEMCEVASCLCSNCFDFLRKILCLMSK